MIDSFADELCKIAAELPYKGEQRIGYAIRKHKPVSSPSKGEKVHLRMGDVHYGESRFGPHFGYEQKGEKVHIFPDRTYVGRTSKKGREERLTVPQKEKARAAIKHMKNTKESVIGGTPQNLFDQTGWLAGQAGRGVDPLEKMKGPKPDDVYKRVQKQLQSAEKPLVDKRIRAKVTKTKTVIMPSKPPVHKVPSIAKAIAKPATGVGETALKVIKAVA